MGSDKYNYNYVIKGANPNYNTTTNTKKDVSFEKLNYGNNNKSTTILTKVNGSTEEVSDPPGSPLDFKKGVSKGNVSIDSSDNRPLDYYGADPIFRGRNLVFLSKNEPPKLNYYNKEYKTFTRNITTTNGYWGNKKQQKIDFGKDTFSLGINSKTQDTIPTYNLTKNKIQNFTLPNGQNLLSFLKENNVRTGDNVKIKITKDGVELQKTESN